jgi:DNA-binding CsgD family transcriptional regulator
MTATRLDVAHALDDRSAEQVPMGTAIGLFEALSTRGFCAALLRSVNAWTSVDKCSLMRFTPDAECQIFGAETLSPQSRASIATIAYIDHYHRFDPNRRLLERTPEGDRPLLRRQTASQVENRGYRRECYENPGIVDRMSVIGRDTKRGLIVLNLYRVLGSNEFSAGDAAALAALAPLVTAAGTRHIELLLNMNTDPATWRQRLRMVCPALTGRELDVAASLLAGRTLRESSAALGIAYSSVVTYRERAYSRFGVQTLKELRGCFTSS